MINESIMPGMAQPAALNSADTAALLEISRNLMASTAALISQTAENTKEIAALKTSNANLAERISYREQSETLSSAQRKTLSRIVNHRIYELLNMKRVNGKLSTESKRIGKVYSPLFYTRIYAHLKVFFDVNEYGDIRAIDFDKAKEMAQNWTPDEGIEELKREAEENWSINNPEIDLNAFLGRLL